MESVKRQGVFAGAVVALACSFGWTTEVHGQSQTPLLRISVKSLKDFPGKWIAPLKEIATASPKAGPQAAMAFQMAEGAIGAAGDKIPGLDGSKPAALRIMYKAPQQGSQAPVDGDILLVLPTSDADKLTTDGFPKMGLPKATKGGDGLYTIPVTPAIQVFGRAANGYLYMTVADQNLVAAANLPSPNQVTGDGSHDFSFVLNPSAIPLEVRKKYSDMAKGLAAAAPPPKVELKDPLMGAFVGIFAKWQAKNQTKGVEQMLEQTDALSFHLDMDVDQKLTYTVSSKPTPNSEAAKDITPARGPLASKAALTTDAPVAAYFRLNRAQFGDELKEVKEELLKPFEGKKQTEFSRKAKAALEAVWDGVLKDGFSEFVATVDDKGVLVAATKVADAAGVERGLEEAVDALTEGAKSGDLKVKEGFADRLKKEAATVGKSKIVRLALPDKDKPEGFEEIYAGVQEQSLFVAFGKDGQASVEKAMKNVVATSDFDFFKTTVSFSAAAKLLGLKGVEAGSMEASYTGGEEATFQVSIPLKDMAPLIKAGFFDKLSEMAPKP